MAKTTIYCVEIVPGDGPPLRYREKGGSIFAMKQYAIDRYEYHVRAGRNVNLLEGEVTWKEIDEY